MSTNRALLDKDFCSQKLQSLVTLLSRLGAEDYPHTDSAEAMRAILDVFEGHLKELGSVLDTDSPETILEFCRRANTALVRFNDFVGLTLRSSNTRNAFELYFPIKVLATELVGKDTRVVLGSEWDFSPYTYPIAIKELPNFVFIGIPASESENPLIIPLAGHELGHVVWQRKGAKASFDPLIRTAVVDLYKKRWNECKALFKIELAAEKIEDDLFVRTIWSKSFKLAQRQLEEIFCDFTGIYIFGRAFLHSFRYLIAPSLGHFRNYNYPRIERRVAYMEALASSYELSATEGFKSSFSQVDPQLSPDEEFIVAIADEATDRLYLKLPPLLEQSMGDAEKFTTGNDDEARVEHCLRALVPPGSIRSIAAIVNAGWNIRLKLEDWNILEHIEEASDRSREKRRVLRDLVLKSFEVSEYRKRLENAP